MGRRTGPRRLFVSTVEGNPMAKEKNGGPLTDAHYAKLCELERHCLETGEYLKKCAACGINVDPEERRNAEQLETVRKLRANFFPNRK